MHSTVADRIAKQDLHKLFEDTILPDAQEIFHEHDEAQHAVFIIKGPGFEDGTALKVYRSEVYDLLTMDQIAQEVWEEMQHDNWTFDDDFDMDLLFGGVWDVD